MNLYGGIASPYVARVAMAAQALGLELAVEDVPGGMKSAEHLAINPVGKIPAFVDGDVKLGESETIVEYLCDRNPEAGLRPKDPAKAATSRMIGRIVDLYLGPAALPIFRMSAGPDRDQTKIDAQFEETRRALSYIESLAGPGPYLVGDSLTPADCATVTMLAFGDYAFKAGGQPDLLSEFPKTGAAFRHAVQSDPAGTAIFSKQTTAIEAFLAKMRGG